MNKNILYIASNPDIPNFVKVGITDDMQRTLEELSGPGLRIPYKLIRSVAMHKPENKEALINKIFGQKYRAKGKKGFYKVEIMNEDNGFMELIQGWGEVDNGSDISPPEKTKDITSEPSKKEEKLSPLNFDDLNIKPGSKLILIEDEKYTCEVVGGRKVEYLGEINYLSTISKIIQKELGIFWKSTWPAKIWSYNGESLLDIRERYEIKKSGRRYRVNQQRKASKSKEIKSHLSTDKSSDNGNQKRAPNFSFEMLGIEKGCELVFVHDESFMCHVSNQKKVSYKGQEMSITRASKIAFFDSKGKNVSNTGSLTNWRYNGERLSQRYKRMKPK